MGTLLDDFEVESYSPANVHARAATALVRVCSHRCMVDIMDDGPQVVQCGRGRGDRLRLTLAGGDGIPWLWLWAVAGMLKGSTGPGG